MLRGGVLCHLAVGWGERPHVTPVVFVAHGGSLWFTTSRTSVKARAWRRDPAAAGLVRQGARAVAFRGTVRTYDLLDPATWGRSLASVPRLTRAATAFTLRNARFFAGYARDAARVPLAWTPPGRVFAELGLRAIAVLDLEAGAVVERAGAWPSPRRRPTRAYRRLARVALTDRTVPDDVLDAVGISGEGALGFLDPLTVLPARWRRDAGQGCYLATLPAAFLDLATWREGQAGLTVDRRSAWRAREMRGMLLQGTARPSAPVPDGGEQAKAVARAGGRP
ncbi:MAG TPA: pyridoxamine 5'-phosphate oxidase family protein, partial [Actinomycetota bacterium]|nr:pyridoxamine 5'-phosphate oxidase family protein [Actinomycetota bacterium]